MHVGSITVCNITAVCCQTLVIDVWWKEDSILRVVVLRSFFLCNVRSRLQGEYGGPTVTQQALTSSSSDTCGLLTRTACWMEYEVVKI